MTKDDDRIGATIRKFASSYFQVSLDNSKFMRIASYKWDQVKKEYLARSLSNSLAVQASGFSSSATEEEVKNFLESKCAKLSDISRDQKDLNSWNISFDSFDSLLAILSMNLSYQDSKIQLNFKRYIYT